MKLKLIEAGGFAGLKKKSEVDVGDLSPALRDKLDQLFEGKKDRRRKSASRARDREQLFLQLDERIVPVDDVDDDELGDLIRDMKKHLHY